MGNGVNAKVDDGFKKLINRSYTPHFEKYVSKQLVSAEIFHSSTGASSAARIGATVEATVSRKAVLSGAFGLVKAGAKLGLKAVPYVGAASYAYDAYQAVKSPLEAEDFKWNEVSEEFLKEWPARNCIWVRDESERVQDVACYGVDSSVLSAYRKGGQSRREAEQLMQGQMEKLAIPFWEKEKEERGNVTGGVQWTKYVLDACHFDLNGGSCDVKSGSDIRNSISFRLKMRDTEVLTKEKFLQISTPSIDANPTPFVEGTGKPEYQENIKVPAGTVVTIGPVTPENGKPVQISITFGQDSNGNTTAEVATTQRPDLTPGGSEAPNTKPDPDPTPNPDGKPDKKPDGKPDPDGNPDKRPDDKPDPSDKRKEDKKEESKGLLCDFFPKILACDEQPEKEEPNLEIPEEHIDLNFTSDNSFSQFGQCPAPVTFQALGTEYKISLEPACNLAAMMRPFIIAMAWLVASFFVARVVRNNA